MTSPTLKLTFLGSGSAFTVGEGNYQSNVLIENLGNNKKLLFDCGTDARFSCHEQGYSVFDLDSVYISHVHADHTGGLEWLGFSRYFIPSIEISDLYVSQDILPLLWQTLSPGMSTLEDKQASLETFFKVHPINLNRKFVWQGQLFHLQYARHVVNNGVELPCYGLSFTINGKTIYISSDSLCLYHENPELFENADVIFHDCETLTFKSGVHANYTDLLLLPIHIRNKMWLYHFNNGPKPEPLKDGFKGFVQKGQTFLF